MMLRSVKKVFRVVLAHSLSKKSTSFSRETSLITKAYYCNWKNTNLDHKIASVFRYHRKSGLMMSTIGDSSDHSSAGSEDDAVFGDDNSMEGETVLVEGVSSVEVEEYNSVPLSNNGKSGALGGKTEVIKETSIKMNTEEKEETVIIGNIEMIKEGKVEIPKGVNIFYNPTQEFNRDISVLAIQTFLKTENKNEPTILEAMAASGIRSIRYAKEITGVKSIIANDYSQSAVSTIRSNAERNQVDNIVTPSFADASIKMQECRNAVTVVDLDPYGTPTPFLDSAIQCVAEDGLFLVTATDMAVLAGGNHAESCFAKYGSMSLKSKACHEIALRIVSHTVQSTANRYGRVAIPLMSLSVDFYVRLLFKIIKSPKKAKQSVLNTAMIFQCTGCKNITLQPMAATKKGHTTFAQGPKVPTKCENCDSSHHFAGPIWSGRIHNREFLEKMNRELVENFTYLKTFDRIKGMLGLVQEELEDQPLYYDISEICSVVKTSTMPLLQMRSTIMNLGYEVSLTHAGPNTIKTNIPNNKLWDILRAWRLQTNPKPMAADTLGYKVMSRESSETNIDFTIRSDAKPQSQNMNLLRYQTNPQKFWGPGCRDNFKSQGDDGPSKRELNQGKYTKQKRRKTDDVQTN